uniref:Uncharacterized protein n=1 Tax=uncultured bacterium contig00036 TaxID=1181524 RepID=A0A806KJ01_9BACT|nr:hypothetical protein [uncultured bacterium contig00036]
MKQEEYVGKAGKAVPVAPVAGNGVGLALLFFRKESLLCGQEFQKQRMNDIRVDIGVDVVFPETAADIVAFGKMRPRYSRLGFPHEIVNGRQDKNLTKLFVNTLN